MVRQPILLARIAAALAPALVLAAAAGAVAVERETVAHAFEQGIASWYGGHFHGRQTASGEIYDKRGMTAAHRTLPFGTMVLVTHLGNRSSVELRINDRGPFVAGRIIDVSEAAAEQLGFRQAGLAEVRVEILGQVPEADDGRLSSRQRRQLRRALDRARKQRRAVVLPRDVLVPVDPLVGPFAVQVGAFADPDNAARLVRRLRDLGHEARVVTPADGLHRVRAGNYPDRSAAERGEATLRGHGFDTFLVRLDPVR